MLRADLSKTNSAKSAKGPLSDPAALLPWLAEVVNHEGCHLRVKLRGNILHVFAQSAAGLDQNYVLLRLVRSLMDPAQAEHLAEAFPKVYQIYIYSGRFDHKQPDWSTPIFLNRLERHLAQLKELEAEEGPADRSADSQGGEEPPSESLSIQIGELSEGASAIVLSDATLARQGDPDAIARYLSHTLSALDVGVDVVIKAVPGKVRRALGVVTAASPVVSVDPSSDLINRLWIFCRAAYSPDPAMIAEPTAQRLRDLKLIQFQDAVISVQVLGEETPDWRLRVDLTPNEEILREWSRWGDLPSIERLLNQNLDSLGVRILPELKDETLHLVCQSLATGQTRVEDGKELATVSLPAQATVLEMVVPTLEQLAPQGIERVVIYGPSRDGVSPTWLECVDLPAVEHPELAIPTTTLARRGDLPAIAFCLTKCLNPNLDEQLATGGVRVQLLIKDRRLHIMTDGPVCPSRRRVVPLLMHYLRQHPISGIQGVRIYGRRAGQRRPDWNYGYDRQVKQRLVPEAAPEFAASDAYLGDLIQPEETAAAAEAPSLMQRLRSCLAQTYLFTPVDSPKHVWASAPSSGWLMAAWGGLGLLFTLQTDWMTSQFLRLQAVVQEPPAVAAEPPERPLTLAEELARLDWNQTNGGEGLGTEEELGGFATSAINDADLPSSPPQAKVSMAEVLQSSPYPSFRSQQLDEKLALYDWWVSRWGVPDVLVMGSSRALRGVDPAALKQALASLGYEDVSIFNFGINGATAQVVDLVVRQLLAGYGNPKLVIWADGARAFNSARLDVTYNAIAASEGYQQLLAGELPAIANAADEAVISEPAPPRLSLAQQVSRYYGQADQWLSEQAGQVSAVHRDRDRLKTALQGRLSFIEPVAAPPAAPVVEASPTNSTEADLIDADGFLPLDIKFNPATYYLEYARVPGTYDGDYRNFRSDDTQTESLQRLLDYSQQQALPLVFINTPLTDEY